ncbi:GAF domain-containing protein [Virgibacillus halophilus]|uniref:GAF domain-containing protein n=1 Tax=Tigheibacillus halophilus TaxID=361280 RepID=A0ABU5CEN1_9BACI|nr:GAF domain-containing protein [Virgibacillus halophilus]
MFEKLAYTKEKTQNYELVLKQLKAITEDEKDPVANLANASALLFQFLHDVNWVGFYIWKETENELVLGPFQGLPACVRIGYGKGVCGTAVAERKTLRVADVEKFPNHIYCDGASKSEIVIPLIVDDKLFGVLDIDSPETDRFDEKDQEYLEKYAEILEDILN